MAAEVNNMKPLFLFLCISFIAYLSCVSASVPPGGHSLGKVWPMPMNITQDTSKRQQLVSDIFTFNVTGNDCILLRSALARYRKIIFLAGYAQRKKKFARQMKNKSRDELFTFQYPILPGLDVNVLQPCEQNGPDYPSLEMDESYNLTVSSASNSAKLSANSIWGALRGLETFSHIVFEGEEGSLQVFDNKIVDKPRFAHRGILLDTSRHYLPKDVIKANIETMAYNKINVFHWHIVDENSFPYESIAFPSLSGKGAYDQQHVYTQADVAEIVEFARLRGIRVVPEFDTPGHVGCWEKGIPGLLTKCCDSSGKFNGNYGPIDPTSNVTFPFLTTFMKEQSQVWPDHYLHLGGDEVSFDCWKSNPNITKWMQQQGFGDDYSKLENYYEQKLLDIVGGYGSGYVVWQEIFDNGLQIRPDTVIHVWKGDWGGEMKNITAKGLRTLVSAPWYLDYISYGADWANYWNTEPIQYNATEEMRALVMGGEACLWGEFVDGANIQSRLWPRASGVAERLWSPEWIRDVNEAHQRIDEHRCRMVKRGIPAQPPNGPSYCNYEYNPVQKNSIFW